MTDQTAPPRHPRRRDLRIAGALLWGCVVVASAGLWLAHRPDDAAAQGTKKSTTIETDDANESAPESIRIQVDGNGKIDMSKLLEADKTNDPAPAKSDGPRWDPAGVEDFSFTNCDGRTITKQDLLGKPWVAAFVFTRCLGPCPALTRQMRDLQDRFKDEDLQLVTFTVDPDRDTPSALKIYAELNGADLNRWYFLTGDAVDIYGLIHRSFQMPVQDPRRDEEDGKTNYQVIHSQNLMLVDAQGVVVGKFNGMNNAEVAALNREIRRLVKPKSSARDRTAPASGSADIPPDAWYMALPAVNAGLNGVATVLLAAGYSLIRRRRVTAHRNLMLAAFAVSIAFLVCYLAYHAALHHDTGLAGRKFAGQGIVRPVYFAILISHVLLATTVPVLASITIYRGLKADWARHRRIARITYPIWMYVSVTGVLIYAMLYHWPV